MENNYKYPNYNYPKIINIIKLIIIGNIIIFFICVLRINSLEKRINALKESLISKGGDIIKENSIIDKGDINREYSDKDLIGMTYPEINFDKLRNNLFNDSLVKQLYNFLIQLENKLIYLEKEINVTKLFSFYSIRTSYLQKYNIKYNDENITELHNIINWEVIHKSNQLKGIASDKYLSCKYVEIKLGENLCEQRIGIYDSVEEINFEELIKKGHVVLKITNGCHDLVFIRGENSQDIDEIKKKVKYYYQRDFGLKIPEFFHLYSKKRIIME